MFKAIEKKIKWRKFLKGTMVYINKHMDEQHSDTFIKYIKKIDKIHKLDWETEFPMLMMTVLLAQCKNLKELRSEYLRIKADSETFFKEMDKIIGEI